MESDFQRSVSLRASRRAERNNTHQQTKDAGGGFFSPGRFTQDYATKVVWKMGFIRLVLVRGILWMLLILIVLLSANLR